MALTKVPSNLDATVATTQSASDNSTNVATTAYVTTALANLVDSSPSALNTLNELAAALNDDASFSTTVNNSIATKLPLAGGNLTGNLGIGASSPARKLSVNSAGVQIAASFTSTSSTSARIGLVDANTTGDNYVNVAASGDAMALYAGANERMRITSGGNVGIATTTNYAGSGLGYMLTVDSAGASGSILEAHRTANGRVEMYQNATGGYYIDALGSTPFLQLRTGGTDRMRIDANGTLAVGTTDTHAWNNVFDARIRIGARGVLATTTGSTQLGHNFYYDGAYKYIGADFATRYYSNNGEHVWLTAPSGSADGTITFSSARMVIDNSGKVGIGTGTPSGKLEVVDTATSLDINLIGNPPELNLEDSGSTSGQKRARLTLNNQKFSLQGLSDDDNSLTHQFMSMSLANGYTGIGTTDPQRILQVGAHGSGNGEIAIGSSTSGFGSILFGDAASGTALYDGYLQYNHSTRRMLIAAGAQIGAVVHDGKMAAVGGTQYTPDVTMEVNGPLKIRNNTAGGISQSHTNMSVGNSGKLIMNFASIGTMTSGDTIVFTYSAISWKSWFFKIRWSSTGGYMGELWAGGYNNNSNGYGIFNPKNTGSNSGGGVQSTTDGATLTVSRSGQGNTMTLTLNNTHVHPLFEIEYSCGGGEGFPVASRASITVNS